MATDATGTPTPNYAIPTFNTTLDSPSGLGSNAQMAAIDAAIKTVDNKVALKPGMGIVIALGG